MDHRQLIRPHDNEPLQEANIIDYIDKTKRVNRVSEDFNITDEHSVQSEIMM